MSAFHYTSVLRYPIFFGGEKAEIGTIDELMVALDVLNRKHDRAILQQLAGVLGRIVAIGNRPAPVNLKILLKALSAEDRLYVIEQIGDRLQLLIGTAVELRNLLVSLTHLEVEAAILNTIGGQGLRQMVVTSQQLWEILEWLYGENDVLLFKLLGRGHLRRLITHGHELAEILRRIDPVRQAPTIEVVGWDFALGLLRNEVDLREILSSLCTQASAALIERLPSERIVALAGSQFGWYELGRRLSPSKAQLLSKKLQGESHAS
jgi:hypothetical protein